MLHLNRYNSFTFSPLILYKVNGKSYKSVQYLYKTVKIVYFWAKIVYFLSIVYFFILFIFNKLQK